VGRSASLTNSPYADEVRARLPELDILALDPELSVARARQESVRYVRASKQPCLIVDTFPRGLGGELAALLPAWGALRVLIHRDLNPEYVRGESARRVCALQLRPGDPARSG